VSTLTKQIQREPRYLVIDHSSVDVTIHASDYVDAEIDVQLLDISNGGAKLRTSDQVPEGQKLSLKLKSDEITGSVKVDATVCWSQLARGGEWILGCTFKPEIPRLVLDQLAKTGAFDRREDERVKVSIHSDAAWELTPELESVCIINLSSHGFCVASKQPGKPGSRVMLKFEEGRTVTGRCRWQVASEAGFTLGCEFSSTEDYTTLRQIHAETEALLSTEKRGLLRRILGG